MQQRGLLLALTFAPVFLTNAVTAQDASKTGSPEFKIEVYSDFKCPYCKAFAPALHEARTNGIEGSPVLVEYHNFIVHPDAQLAHQAAMAAKEQGKFWEMHDLLFAHQNALKRENLVGYAKELGLDVERFEKDLDSDQTKQVILADQAEGGKRGVEGTPTFFVNGKLDSGTVTLEELTKLVRGEKDRAWALSEITENMMSRGPANAPVTLEFFADLESPVSLPAMDVVNQVMSEYPSAVRLQFRNFPLSFHPQAPMAHAAAMAAAKQGHFWEFARYILDHQDSLREQDLISYAGTLGMDESKFAELVLDRKYTPRVDADMTVGLGRGIRGSPVIFVGDKRIDGVPSLQTLTSYVEAELASKK